MLYVLLIYEKPDDFERRESAVESEAYAGAWRTYHRALLDAGIFVGGKPLKPMRKSLKDVPSKSPESDAMSKALQKAGFKFVGSTICYAFMQASGMVDDHVKGCHRSKA